MPEYPLRVPGDGTYLSINTEGLLWGVGAEASPLPRHPGLFQGHPPPEPLQGEDREELCRLAFPRRGCQALGAKAAQGGGGGAG